MTPLLTDPGPRKTELLHAVLPLRIDLAQLAGVDAEGRRCLRRQERRGASLTGASPYIGLLLEKCAGEAESEPEK